MVRVFGVPSMGSLPLFDNYYKQRCKFRGIDTVRNAFKRRIESMTEQLEKEGDTDKGKRYKHQLEWLNNTLNEMKSFTAVCVEPQNAPTAKKRTWAEFITPGKKDNKGSCPCLTDINLLRDLVFIISTIQGNASDEIKQKIQGLNISKLLEIKSLNIFKNNFDK
jgi:hypothetical protein